LNIQQILCEKGLLVGMSNEMLARLTAPGCRRPSPTPSSHGQKPGD
jgi:hypothetical protein